MIAGGEKESALFFVPEQLDLCLGKPIGFFQPSLLAGGPVQGDQPIDHKCVVVEIGVEPGLFGAVGPHQAAFGGTKVFQHEHCGGLGGFDVSLVIQRPAGVGKTANHQAVPGG